MVLDAHPFEALAIAQREKEEEGDLPNRWGPRPHQAMMPGGTPGFWALDPEWSNIDMIIASTIIVMIVAILDFTVRKIISIGIIILIDIRWLLLPRKLKIHFLGMKVSRKISCKSCMFHCHDDISRRSGQLSFVSSVLALRMPRESIYGMFRCYEATIFWRLFRGNTRNRLL